VGYLCTGVRSLVAGTDSVGHSSSQKVNFMLVTSDRRRSNRNGKFCYSQIIHSIL